MPAQERRTKYLLIDDDPTYSMIMQKVADIEGMDLEVYPSLADLGSVGLLGKYDVAIVDYDLKSMTGVEIAEYLCTLFNVPTVLVSESDRSETRAKWPTSIKKFILKSEGYTYVLKEAEKYISENQKSNSSSDLHGTPRETVHHET